MLPATILRLLLILTALLFFVDKAAACSCEGPRQDPGFHPCMVYSGADAVFTGRVEEVSTTAQDEDGRPVFFHNKVVHFSVDKAFRGVEGPIVEIITNRNTASCGYDFKQGQ